MIFRIKEGTVVDTFYPGGGVIHTGVICQRDRIFEIRDIVYEGEHVTLFRDFVHNVQVNNKDIKVE